MFVANKDTKQNLLMNSIYTTRKQSHFFLWLRIFFISCLSLIFQMHFFDLLKQVGAPARVGLVAPIDVVVPPGNTGLDPSQTSFFQVCHLNLMMIMFVLIAFGFFFATQFCSMLGACCFSLNSYSYFILFYRCSIFQPRLTRVQSKLSPQSSWSRRVTRLALLRLLYWQSLALGHFLMVWLSCLFMTMALSSAPLCLTWQRMTLLRSLLLVSLWSPPCHWPSRTQPLLLHHTCSSMPTRIFFLLQLQLNILILKQRKWKSSWRFVFCLFINWTIFHVQT